MRALKLSLPLSALAVVAIVATAGAERTTVGDGCDDNSPFLEGSWRGIATGQNLLPITDLITFARDGNVIESHLPFVPGTPLGAAIGPLLESMGHGEWVRGGAITT